MGLPIDMFNAVLTDENVLASSAPPYDIDHFKRVKKRGKKGDIVINIILRFDERIYVLPLPIIEIKIKPIKIFGRTIMRGFSIIVGSWLHFAGSMTGCEAYKYTLKDLDNVLNKKPVTREVDRTFYALPMVGESEEVTGPSAVVLEVPPPRPEYVQSKAGGVMMTPTDASEILTTIKMVQSEFSRFY